MISCLPLILSLAAGLAAEDPWQQAEQNARQSTQAIHLANRNTFAWLAHADATTGLVPRRIGDSEFWNAQDCAADNYPYHVLTAYMTDNYYLKQNVKHILAQEQKFAARLDSMTDDFLFSTQKYRVAQPDIARIIFGAAEYSKDGLIPVTEWMGPSPWFDRMQALINDIWKHAPIDDPNGKLPSDNIEVNGDLLQTMGRLYWMTGNEQYKKWCYRLADHYLVETNMLDSKSIWLRDHGCEIIGGLTETYVIALREDPERAKAYRPRLHALLDNILLYGLNDDGLMYNSYNPKSGEPIHKTLSDGWGYVFNGFLTMAMVDDEPRYRDAVKRALANVHKYKGNPWGRSVDDLADSLEGCINLMNRLPDDSAAAWVDEGMKLVFAAQKPDGTMEGWYGDGNSTRTALMYALWKTQGITAAPWGEELHLGAARDEDGTLHVWIASDMAWSGKLRFDRQRHRDYFHMPVDYPRINQFPEWFTINRLASYSVQQDGGEARSVTGRELTAYPLTLKAQQPVKLTIKPLPGKTTLRTRHYQRGSREAALAWQKELRGRFFDLLKLTDLVKSPPALEPKVESSVDKGDYTLQELTLRSTSGRSIKALFAMPKNASGPLPAVVCIHGHGGTRQVVFDPTNIYRGFADVLARQGYITIATDVGQHEVYEPGRTLMGERLWDVMRCVDYLASRPEVDAKRIGCAGLSLGGEMAMWLGAMDVRVAATVSCGYLTSMDQMEIGHCTCWKFDGLRELVDWSDVYAMTAPRALQCQNGLMEPPGGFNVPLAKQCLQEIRPAYQDFDLADQPELWVHAGGHVVDLPGLTGFLEKRLKGIR